MADSKIEWCDHTFNPITLSNGRPKRRSAGYWKLPLKWNREAELAFDSWDTFRDTLGMTDEQMIANGHVPFHRPRVFCASLADWLDDEVPIEWLADLLKLIHDTPNLDWILLSKRPENWRERLNLAMETCNDLDVKNWLCDWLDLGPNGGPGKLPSNCWIGTTVENQEMADKRIPELLQIPAKVRFLSCEPLLGAVDIEEYLDDVLDGGYMLGSAPIHWVICGGESGSNARPMHPDWARSLRDQCQAGGVPFFFKQWGEWGPRPSGSDEAMEPWFDAPCGEFHDGKFIEDCLCDDGTGIVYRVGKKAAGRLLDGREWSEFPKEAK